MASGDVVFSTTQAILTAVLPFFGANGSDGGNKPLENTDGGSFTVTTRSDIGADPNGTGEVVVADNFYQVKFTIEVASTGKVSPDHEFPPNAIGEPWLDPTKSYDVTITEH
jgi:hypothetical protein